MQAQGTRMVAVKDIVPPRGEQVAKIKHTMGKVMDARIK